MKKYLELTVLSLAGMGFLSACDPGTPLGNLLHKPRNYVSSAGVENKTNQPMYVSLSVSEWTSENACDAPQYSKTESSFEPGQKGEIITSLHCAKSDNALPWRLHVSADGFTKDYSVNAQWVQYSVSCVQGNCEVHADCHEMAGNCSF